VQKGTTRGAGIAAFFLVILGVLLLLNNYLLSSFDIGSLWPLLLVIAGVIILIQGDLNDPASTRTFGITRGTVESGAVEVNAGEIDVHLHASVREGRLAAGQYAANSRPALEAQGTHAHLRLDRAATPWLSFSDWEIGVAPDLPWQVFISTHLGAVCVDLNDIIVANAVIATGIGDIRLTLSREAFEPLYVQSAVGDIHIYTPPGSRALIRIQASPLTNLHIDENRYEQSADGDYVARATESVFQPVEVYVKTTFGDVYLA
jgi:hypothetical protein